MISGKDTAGLTRPSHILLARGRVRVILTLGNLARRAVAVRTSGEIFRDIRRDVFDSSQGALGKRLGLTRETVGRLEGHKQGHRVLTTHLEWLRALKPPGEKSALFQALLQELAAAIDAEKGAERSAAGSLPSSSTSAADEAEQAEHAEWQQHLEEVRSAVQQVKDTAVQVEQWHLLEEARRTEEAQRAEQARLAEERRHADETKRMEEATRRMEEVAGEIAQFHRLEEARREAQEERRQKEEAQRAAALATVTASTGEAKAAAETARQATEQAQSLWRALEQQRAEEVAQRKAAQQEAEEKAQEAEQLQRRLRRESFAVLATCVVMMLVTGATVWKGGRAPEDRPPEPSHASEAANVPAPEKQEPEKPKEVSEESAQPEEEASTTGLDGGTVVVKTVLKAKPIPNGPVQTGHRHGTCPSGAEKFNDYCYNRVRLSLEQVQGGACTDPGLYEPEEGWCVAHLAAYRPVLAPRPRNSVESP